MTTQIAAYVCDGLPEGVGGHQRGVLTRLCSSNRQQIGSENLMRRTLRFLACKVTPVQQAHGQWRQHTQHASQPFNAPHLALFDAACGFQIRVRVLHNPPVRIPSDVLPRVLKRRRRNRGQQNPFQRLFSDGRVLFPDA
ncbi:MAG: hypothetical protein ABI234_05390, partial [Ktedonobacteraceae bacterium]